MAEPLSINRSLVFPRDLASYPYWMTFNFYQYKRPLVGSRDANITAINGIKSQGARIRLPLPNNMIDVQDITYSEDEAGLVAGMAINAFQSAGGTGAGLAAGIGAGIAGQAAAGALGLAQVSKRVTDLVGQMAGVATNPFLTVMFRSPKFKRHQLSWRLSPTNRAETTILRSIVHTFKFNQLPDMTGSLGGALLTYPNLVQINVSNEGTFPYKFKPAVIESLAINYTPAGQPSFFGSTSAPTEIEIRLSLLEIEFYLQRDYGDPNTTGLSLVGDVGNFINTTVTGTVEGAMRLARGLGTGPGPGTP